MGKRSQRVQGQVKDPLSGLREYLEENQYKSIFKEVGENAGSLCLFLHGGKEHAGKVQHDDKFEFDFLNNEGELEKIHKVKVKFLCPLSNRDMVLKQIKRDENVAKNCEGPHFSPRFRHHIKNKSLYPLMNRKEVLFFTLVEGEVLRGIIIGFSRYEINLNMKQGAPVTLFRHSIYDIRDKKGRSYLKNIVEKNKNYW